MSLGTPRRPVTLAQVAAEAGVSSATVHRVLNSAPHVPPRTADQVNRAIARLGRGAPIPRRMHDQTTATVLLRCPQPMDEHVGPLVSAAADVLERSGWPVWLSVGEHVDVAGGPGILDPRRGVAGALFVQPSQTCHSLLATRPSGLPAVVVDPRRAPPAGVTSVVADHREAGRLVARHVLGRGHRRVALLGGTCEGLMYARRMDGLMSELNPAGATVSVVPAHLQLLTSTLDHGREVARWVLEQRTPPTALICLDDRLAAGAMQAAAELDLSVPDDLVVTGFGDYELSRATVPRLTTVQQPLEALGRLGATLLIDQLARRRVPLGETQVPVELVARGSSAGPDRGAAVVPA
ncbi:LacI family DNA-binding transcriptional regulator [Cellulomonas sp. URHD0024]|uniref:LacI family DNA-binding transcriptional regulator n=1 Tax=Cellulomonas sp. URHD0024 TaxID=1302620 RepID=UPI00040C0006|nr:LacI family DNA-binding transcriptional regulator [Cellulomonas sp. URHD0024]